jgi:hypothetical protein
MNTRCPEVSKSQQIRVLDVVLLGPGTIAAGLYRSPLPLWARVSLIGYGIATIGYNWHNYQATRRLNRL